MLRWIGRRERATYTPPEDHPPPPVPPRVSWQATAADGALLEAFRWGSVLGEPFVLELRRYGVPFDDERERTHGDELVGDADGPTHELAELPTLAELQSAADECVPTGTLLMLAVLSNGPGVSYPSREFRAVRLIQAAVELQGSGPRTPRGIRS